MVEPPRFGSCCDTKPRTHFRSAMTMPVMPPVFLKDTAFLEPPQTVSSTCRCRPFCPPLSQFLSARARCPVKHSPPDASLCLLVPVRACVCACSRPIVPVHALPCLYCGACTRPGTLPLPLPLPHAKASMSHPPLDPAVLFYVAYSMYIPVYHLLCIPHVSADPPPLFASWTPLYPVVLLPPAALYFQLSSSLPSFTAWSSAFWTPLLWRSSFALWKNQRCCPV